jgi:hypothetical protein
VNWARRIVLGVVVFDAICLLLFGLFGVYGRYETTHDIPNPFWATFNRTFTYTPEQGPPSRDLFATRPDIVVRQYLADYLRLAGTYPCVQNLDGYNVDYDPFLDGKPCTVVRPVASVAITSVTVAPPGCDCGPAMAEVHFRVLYTDGQSYLSFMTLVPIESDPYWLTETHMDCWMSNDFFRLYSDIVSQAPPGVRYRVRGEIGGYRCQPAETTG